MDQAVSTLLAQGLSPQSLATYRTGITRYLNFCHQLQLIPLPASQSNLCRFVAVLHHQNISHATIRVYLSGVRFLQIRSGGPDPSRADMPQLHYVLRAAKRAKPLSTRSLRLPITPRILRLLLSIWSIHPVPYTARMLWAACCLGFFAFLRSGEFVCPNNSMDSRAAVLQFPDVSVDDRVRPSALTLTLRGSKTDVFRAGLTLHVGATGDSICPVAAVLGYLTVRPPTRGPLFIHEDGSPLLRPLLVREVREALSRARPQEEWSQFSGHSFRIGAATTAARTGVPDSMIQALGRWKSSAFLSYIRTPPESLAAMSRVLASSNM